MISLDRLAKKKTLRVAGLMSGTSADAVDVAVIDISDGGVEVVAFEMIPYPPPLRRRIFRLFGRSQGTVEHVCRMNFALGEVFAGAILTLCRKHAVSLESIDAIGSHGQTIWHDPAGWRCGGRRISSTLQIGEPAVIAERTGILTVADFRTRDMAAGGQGAPLVPYADFVLFRHARRNRAIQNIGGIANVTFLPARGGLDGVLAFDTGPGNMIIDRLTQVITNGRLAFDRGGKAASHGCVDEKLLAEWMRHPYFRRHPPKSTGRELFGVHYADRLLAAARARGLADQDILATATAFTAQSIAEAYRRLLPGKVDEVILCGGGSWNRTLVDMICRRLAGTPVRQMDDLGISVDAKEAVSFAILAYATLRGRPGNVPSATGARRPVVLGKIILP